MLEARTGRLITLDARALVGRSAACPVVVDDPRASAEHAAIAWSGERWEIRDLGSLNGTWVDGRRLAAGERAALRRDTRLGFGSADGAWILADDRPAGPTARNEATAELVPAPSGLLALPSADDPRATIFRRGAGPWQLELGAELRAIADRELIELDGVRWSVFLPGDLGAVPTTLEADGAPPALGDAALWFTPSLDEEHVEVRVRVDGGGESVLASRSSHYLLLTLARARIEDARAGVAADEAGWVYASDLAGMLRYGAERLNIEIFRARTVFARLGFVDAPHLIERRPSSRQLRIGIARLHVVRPGEPHDPGEPRTR